MSKYTESEAEQWAEEYKRCYSFAEVGRVFGIDKDTVKRYLIKNKNKYNVKTKQDLINEGLRRCGKCKEIKPLDLFGSHWQKSRCNECSRKMSAEYRKNNHEKCLAAERKWYHANRKKKIKYKKQYNAKQKDNIEYKLKKRLRNRIRDAIKNNKKAGSAIKDLGCTLGELKIYLEKQFYNNLSTGEQMTWNNYGFYGWHIDHIRPLALFNLNNRKQFLEACNYINLQPLWFKDHDAKTAQDLAIINNKQKGKM